MFFGKKTEAIIPAHNPDKSVAVVSFLTSDVFVFLRLSSIKMDDARGAVKAAATPAPAPAAMR